MAENIGKRRADRAATERIFRREASGAVELIVRGDGKRGASIWKVRKVARKLQVGDSSPQLLANRASAQVVLRGRASAEVIDIEEVATEVARKLGRKNLANLRIGLVQNHALRRHAVGWGRDRRS